MVGIAFTPQSRKPPRLRQSRTTGARSAPRSIDTPAAKRPVGSLRGLSEIRIDDALRPAAPGREPALVHRRVAARDVVAHDTEDLQADRVGRVVGLGAGRRSRQHGNYDRHKAYRSAHRTLPEFSDAVKSGLTFISTVEPFSAVARFGNGPKA